MASKIEIDALNCGAGDIKLSFNANDPMEVARATRIVKDMLRRGYALFVQGQDGRMTRVDKFDETRGEYVIADGPDGSAPALTESVPAEESAVETVEAPAPEKKKRGRPVKMSQVKLVAVGRSAGG